MVAVDGTGVPGTLLDMETELRHLVQVSQGLECLIIAEQQGLGKTHDVRLRARDVAATVSMIAALAEAVERKWSAALDLSTGRAVVPDNVV